MTDSLADDIGKLRGYGMVAAKRMPVARPGDINQPLGLLANTIRSTETPDVSS